MDKRFLVAGSSFGLLAVILGAFGAHALQEHLSANQIATFETGVRYQMYHALLLFILGLIAKVTRAKTVIFWLLCFGIVLFSFSIYMLATNNLTTFDFRTIAFITPIGGTLLIAAWVLLLARAISLKNK